MKIFVISLKDSPRRKKIKESLEARNNDFEFFDAIDARIRIPNQYEERINRKYAEKALCRPMLNGEIGAALSHALVYDKICSQQIEHSIVLEDDAIITNDFAKIIQRNLLVKSTNIDMAFLCHFRCFVKKKPQIIGNFSCRKVAFMPFSATAYYINLSVARMLQKETETIAYLADFPVAVDTRYRVVAFYPRLVQHPLQTTQTSIEGRPKRLWKNHWKRWIKMILLIAYFENKSIYGSFLSYLRRVYFRKCYQNISPNYHEE